MSLPFHNMTVDINQMWFKSHKDLIRKVARELGSVDKSDELIEMFLGPQTKFKKHKDPNAPKRPKTGFLIFCDEFRGKVKDKQPDLQMCDVMKELGKIWVLIQTTKKKPIIKSIVIRAMITRNNSKNTI